MPDVPSLTAAEGADTPVGRLTLLCARAPLSGDEESRAELEKLLSDGDMPWDSVMSTLVGHGLGRVFLHLVRRNRLEALVPKSVRERLDSLQRRGAIQSLILEAALLRIEHECAANGIELIVLKGLFLSRVVYEASDVRPIGDIDLLVRSEDVHRFRAVLVSLGCTEYNQPLRLPWRSPAASMAFRMRVPEVDLDVHTLVVPEKRYRPCAGIGANESEVWLGSTRSTWLGSSLREMRPEHLLIYLCLHVTVRHTFAQALWLVDLREALRHYREILDFDHLCERAQDWRLVTFVYMGLLAARQYAGADVPDHVLERLRPSYGGARALESMVLAGEAFNSLRGAPVPRADRLMALLRDTWPARFSAIVQQPYHDARHALRHWEPWARLKRRREASAMARASGARGSAEPSPRAIRLIHVLWSGGVGGAERAVYQLARAQVGDEDLDVAVAFGQGTGPYAARVAECGCTVVDAGFRWGGDLLGVIRLSRALRRYDIHHIHTPQPAMVVASLLAGKRVRVFTQRRGAFERGLRRRLRDAAMTALLREFDAFSGNTLHAATTAAGEYRISPDRFSVTYNGLDFGLLEPHRSRGEVRRELGLPAEAVVVGTAANLRPIKRIDRLVDAALALRGDGMRLLVLGDGPGRAGLEAQAAALGVADRVCFSGVQDQVADYLSAMDVFVLATGQEESFGNAAVEAMALGVPTVVFADGGGLIEHVDDRVDGFVVSDEAALHSVLRELIDDPGLRRSIGARGSEVVRRRYTTGASAASYRDLYARALANAGREPGRMSDPRAVVSGGSPVALATSRVEQH